MSALALLVGLFQNCSGVSFSSSNSAIDDDPGGGKEGEAEYFRASQVFDLEGTRQAQKVDILFVLDESVSMNNIINNVRLGIESVESVSFPQSTRIAVTNMAPAQVKDGVVNFLLPWVSGVSAEHYPGFIRLVNGEGIQSLRDNTSLDGKFGLDGCENAWFSPKDLHPSGHSCLRAATQIAATATHAEVGLVSLYQLLQRTQLRGEKLFRDGSVANVIFVSDTHDPGTNYYGTKNAHAQPPSRNEIMSLIDSMHDLAGLHFNGVVPLPWSGHPKLSELEMIGEVSESEEAFFEEHSGEQFRESFTYIDFIKASGGVAVDSALTTDWTSAMEQMIEYTSASPDPLVTLEHPVHKILKVMANGSLVPEGEYDLIGNDTLRLLNIPSATFSLHIEVDYLY